jgi:hypothetical protein
MIPGRTRLADGLMGLSRGLRSKKGTVQRLEKGGVNLESVFIFERERVEGNRVIRNKLNDVWY